MPGQCAPFGIVFSLAHFRISMKKPAIGRNSTDEKKVIRQISYVEKQKAKIVQRYGYILLN